MWISESDIERLTGNIGAAWQRKKLNKMGIPFVVSGTGRPLVKPEDVGGSNEPKFDAIAKKREAKTRRSVLRQSAA